MMKFKLVATLAAVLMLARAAVAADAPLPSADAIEAYLNGITTMTSRFVQSASDGSQFTGTFLLKRPGRLRFEYDPPTTDFIVADGLMVHYYDGQMKQESSAPIGQSLANFFLQKDLKLSGDLSISDIQRQDGLVQMRLVQTKDPLAGDLTLLFSENPLQLRAWRIVDAQGVTTTVTLSESQFGVPLKNNLFHYYDPKNKESLINK